MKKIILTLLLLSAALFANTDSIQAAKIDSLQTELSRRVTVYDPPPKKDNTSQPSRAVTIAVMMILSITLSAYILLD